MNDAQWNWRGLKGTPYRFAYHRVDQRAAALPGIVILARHQKQGVVPLLVGEAEDVARLLAAGALDEALALGANHVHVKIVDSGRAARQSISLDLTRTLAPPLGHRSDAAVPRPEHRKGWGFELLLGGASHIPASAAAE